MSSGKTKFALQKAANSTRYEKYLSSSEPVLNREEREDVILQRKLDEDTDRVRDIAVQNQQQLQAELNRINRTIDAQFATLLSQGGFDVKIPTCHYAGMHSAKGNGTRTLVGPQVLSSSPHEGNHQDVQISSFSAKSGGKTRRAGYSGSSGDLRGNATSPSASRSVGGTSLAAGRKFSYSALTGGVFQPEGTPPPLTHRGTSSMKSNPTISNYAIAFPVPFEESGFSSVIRWADIAYEEAVVAAVGPGADIVKLRQQEMPSRVLVTVICYLLNEILCRDSNLKELWEKFRAPLFDAVYSPQMVGAEMARRQEEVLKRKKGKGGKGGGVDRGSSIRKLLLQKDQEAIMQRKARSGFLEGMSQLPISSRLGKCSTRKDNMGYLASQSYGRGSNVDQSESTDDKDITDADEEDECGVLPAFPARYMQYTNQYDYSSYCLWTEEMIQAKRLNKVLGERVTRLKEVVAKSRLVLDLAGYRVDRYRKQFIFAAWRAYMLYMRRCRQTATTYIARQKNNRLLESCFLKWRRVPLQEKVSNLEAQVRELRRKLQMTEEVHQSEIASLKAKGKAAQDMLQDITFKDEALRNQMLESHRLETTGLQVALTKATRKGIQLQKHSRRWERLAKTSRPMILCRSVPKSIVSLSIELRGLEEELLINTVPAVGSIAEAFPFLARKGFSLMEQVLCRWVNFVMQSSPHYRSWVPVVECAKKLNAAPPTSSALLATTSTERGRDGSSSTMGRRGISPPRRRSSQGSDFGEGDRLSTVPGSRRTVRSRGSSMFPGMISLPSSPTAVGTALYATLLGPLPDAAEAGQLSPSGLLMVVRELRRLLPKEVMDLENELGLGNSAGSTGGTSTPFTRTMNNYVGSLENRGNRNSTPGQGFGREVGNSSVRFDENNDEEDEEEELGFASPDPSSTSSHATRLSSRASSVLYSPNADGRVGRSKSTLSSRARRSGFRRKTNHPRHLIKHSPPSPFALYQELTELLHCYSSEGLFPSLLQQCPYLEAFYSPLGLAYLSNPYFYCWILAALFTGYVQKMVLMENAPCASGATPSAVRHYLRHPQKELQIAKRAHPVVSATASAEVINIPPFLVEELQAGVSSNFSTGAGTHRQGVVTQSRKLQSSSHFNFWTKTEEEERETIGNSGGSHVISKDTTIGKNSHPIITFVNSPAPKDGSEGLMAGAGVPHAELDITGAELSGLSPFPDPSLSVGASSPLAQPLLGLSSLALYPAYGSGGGGGKGGGVDPFVSHNNNGSSSRVGTGGGGGLSTGPFRITNFHEVPTVREGIDSASDMSVFLGCHMEDLPDSEEEEYDVREMEMDMVKEEEELFAMQRASRWPNLRHRDNDSGGLDESEWKMMMMVDEDGADSDDGEEGGKADNGCDQGLAEGKDRVIGVDGHRGKRIREKGKTYPEGEREESSSRHTEPLYLPSPTFRGGDTDHEGGDSGRRSRSQSEHKAGQRNQAGKSSGNNNTSMNRSIPLNQSFRPASSSFQFGSSRHGKGRGASVPSFIRQIGGAGAWFPRLSITDVATQGNAGGLSGEDRATEDHLMSDEDSNRLVHPNWSVYSSSPNKDPLGSPHSRQESKSRKKSPVKAKGLTEGGGGESGLRSPKRGEGGAVHCVVESSTAPGANATPPFFWEKDDETLTDIKEVNKVAQALENQMTRERKRNRVQCAAFFLDPKEDILSVEQVQFLHLLPRPSKAFNAVLHRDQIVNLQKSGGRRRFFGVGGYQRQGRSHFSNYSSKDVGESSQINTEKSQFFSVSSGRQSTNNGGRTSSQGTVGPNPPLRKVQLSRVGKNARLGSNAVKKQGTKGQKKASLFSVNGADSERINFLSSEESQALQRENHANAEGNGGGARGKENSFFGRVNRFPKNKGSSFHVRNARSSSGQRRKDGGRRAADDDDDADNNDEDEDGEDNGDEGADALVEGEKQHTNFVPPQVRRNLERLSVLTFTKRLVRDQVHRQQWLGVSRIITSLITRVRVLDVGPGLPDRDHGNYFRLHYRGGSNDGGGWGGGGGGRGDRRRTGDMSSMLSRRDRSPLGNGGGEQGGIFHGTGPLSQRIRSGVSDSPLTDSQNEGRGVKTSTRKSVTTTGGGGGRPNRSRAIGVTKRGEEVGRTGNVYPSPGGDGKRGESLIERLNSGEHASENMGHHTDGKGGERNQGSLFSPMTTSSPPPPPPFFSSATMDPPPDHDRRGPTLASTTHSTAMSEVGHHGKHLSPPGQDREGSPPPAQTFPALPLSEHHQQSHGEEGTNAKVNATAKWSSTGVTREGVESLHGSPIPTTGSSLGFSTSDSITGPYRASSSSTRLAHAAAGSPVLLDERKERSAMTDGMNTERAKGNVFSSSSRVYHFLEEAEEKRKNEIRNKNVGGVMGQADVEGRGQSGMGPREQPFPREPADTPPVTTPLHHSSFPRTGDQTVMGEGTKSMASSPMGAYELLAKKIIRHTERPSSSKAGNSATMSTPVGGRDKMGNEDHPLSTSYSSPPLPVHHTSIMESGKHLSGSPGGFPQGGMLESGRLGAAPPFAFFSGSEREGMGSAAGNGSITPSAVSRGSNEREKIPRLGTAHISPIPVLGDGAEPEATPNAFSGSSSSRHGDLTNQQRSSEKEVPMPQSFSQNVIDKQRYDLSTSKLPSPASVSLPLSSGLGRENVELLEGKKSQALSPNVRENSGQLKSHFAYSSCVPSDNPTKTRERLQPLRSLVPNDGTGGNSLRFCAASSEHYTSRNSRVSRSDGIPSPGGFFQGEIPNTSLSTLPALKLMTGSGARQITPAQHALDSIVIHSPAQVPRHSLSKQKDRFDICPD